MLFSFRENKTVTEQSPLITKQSSPKPIKGSQKKTSQKKIRQKTSNLKQKRKIVTEREFNVVFKRLLILTKQNLKYRLLESLNDNYYLTMKQFIQILKTFIFFGQQRQCTDLLKSCILDAENVELLYKDFDKESAKLFETILEKKMDVTLVGNDYAEVNDDYISSDYEEDISDTGSSVSGGENYKKLSEEDSESESVHSQLSGSDEIIKN
ncbi:hypothetical protein M0813_16444 [Anaeramoeba flamelloides]|uniref:DUF4476 domain-containing protein n=1 Tax=Anaeramoeba flamelloides TaxID=1746091 RepID=A0ABQ8YZS1_9EUKA|nr:hypothetical protein M0813_16444 [Anaeramoeba flamelloides]